MKANTGLTILAAITTAWSSLAAADWPQYLGPNRNSTSPEKGLLRSWPESGPEVPWTVSVGRGYGGPVIKDGKVYLLDRDDDVGDNLRCFDLSSGKVAHDHVFTSDEAQLGSFLQDLEVDARGETVYVGDVSFWRKNPAILVYDVASG